MKEFYEFLAKKGVRSLNDVQKVIGRLSIEDAVDFGKQCQEFCSVSKPSFPSTSLFNFSANSSLSGDIYPCATIECRLEAAGNLATFAGLYADGVLITNPFNNLEHYLPKSGKKTDNDFFYEVLIGDVGVVMLLKPFLETGIIQINPANHHFHDECLWHTIGYESNLKSEIEEIKTDLENTILSKVKFTLEKMGDDKILRVDDPEEYTDFKIRVFSKVSPQFKNIDYHVFTPKEVRQFGFLEMAMRNPLLELITQRYMNTIKDLSYLTNRKIDTEILKSTKEKERTYNRALLGGMVHSLPFLINVSPTQLIKFRSEEQPAFIVYRSAIKKVLEETKKENSEKTIKEAVNEIVIPEIAKIDQIVKKNRESFQKDAGSKLIFNSIIISAGLMGAFLNLSPSIITGSAIAGTFAASETYKDIIASMKEPKEIADNDYYFLWKIKQKTKSHYI